jgi:hypothetical protein
VTQLLVKRWRVVEGGGDAKLVLSAGFFTQKQADTVCAKLRRKTNPGARVEPGQ